MPEADGQDRLERLLGYLEHDPANAPLLRDAAQAALDADDPERAKELCARLRDAGGLTDADSNLWAIAAMRSGEPEKAAETFAGLLEGQPGDPALGFNLAWALALSGDAAGARRALEPAIVEALPQAALLEVQLMHQAGAFEEAAARAQEHLRRHGDYPPLLAALSVLALDIEDEALARQCAERAGGHPDALATLALLALGEQETERAREMFERSLAINAHSPRAWIGLGLAELMRGDSNAAAGHLDRGAGMFADHLGSWIAAGWAHLLAGERGKARERFERALALDENFAEAQGSLAVIEALEGDGTAAARRAEIALRLDRHCFSATFARILLSTAAGDAQSAQRLLEAALRQPIGPRNHTIAEAIARLAR